MNTTDPATRGAKRPKRNQGTIADDAIRRAEQAPNEIAFYMDSDDQLTYGEVLQYALQLAGSLQTMGLERGDVVSFQLPNWRETSILNVASAYLGLTLCPIIPIYRSKEVKFILADSQAKAHFTPRTYRGFDYSQMLGQFRSELGDLREIVYLRDPGNSSSSFDSLLAAGAAHSLDRPEVDADSRKLLLYTSGTTGTPKAVLHSHNSIRTVAQNSIDFWRLDKNDVMLMASPVTHITGYLFGLEFPFYCGNKTVLMEKWNAGDAVDLINQHQVTLSIGATPFLVELTAEARRSGDRLPSLRYFVCGGAAVPPNVIEEVWKHFENCRAFRVYGSTETPMVTQGFVGDEERELAATTDGKIVGYDVKIVDANGKSLPQGEDGEILVRGPSMLVGYGLRGTSDDCFDEGGFFRTGDLGHVTAEGGLVISGRIKDLIIRGGENLSAQEIEDALSSEPSVHDIAMPHDRLGETVCAYVVPGKDGPEPSVETLSATCDKAGLAKQKWPQRVEIVPELSRTPSGKVRKNVLRQKIRQKIAEEPGS